MSETIPPVAIGYLGLPVADAAAATAVAEAMSGEMTRLWQVDRAAGLDWRGELGALQLDLAPGEGPEALGRRLAGAIRARLVRERAGEDQGS